MARSWTSIGSAGEPASSTGGTRGMPGAHPRARMGMPATGTMAAIAATEIRARPRWTYGLEQAKRRWREGEFAESSPCGAWWPSKA